MEIIPCHKQKANRILYTLDERLYGLLKRNRSKEGYPAKTYIRA